MKLIAYMRVSTEGQNHDDKFGLDAQRKSIEDYCQKNGHEIIAWREDVISGAKEDRPMFSQIVNGSDELIGEADGVIVAKSDRIARDVYIYFAYKNELRKQGLTVISVAEDFGEMGAYGVILDAMIAAIADVERENIKNRTSGGRKQKAMKGGYSGGKAPYGYRVLDHELIINEDEAKLVRGIYELRRRGYAMQKIADALNDKGYRTRNGKDFQQAHIRNILLNEQTYRGMYRYKGCDWVQGKHKAIL